MVDNKNNTLNEDTEQKSQHKKRSRRHKKAPDTKGLNYSSTFNLDDILDSIGASGITYVMNGESGGNNSVSPDEFDEILRNIIDKFNNQDKPKAGLGKTTAGTDYAMVDNSARHNQASSFDDEFDWDDDETDGFYDEVPEMMSNLMGDDYCPAIESIFKLMMKTRPFGIDWEFDKVLDFLRANGYTICDKMGPGGNVFKVAVKDGVTKPLSELNNTNISREFSATIQDILLGWLMKIK